MSQTLANSGLLTGEFQVFSDDIGWTSSGIEQATASAHAWLGEQDHPNFAGMALIHRDRLGQHVVAMGNLILGYAQAMRRSYSRNQRRDWRIIIDFLYSIVEARNGAQMEATVMPQQLREQIRISLLQEDLYVDRFFEDDAESESLSGDMDVLLQYISHQAADEFQRREVRARTIRQEPSVLGKVSLWARQRWES